MSNRYPQLKENTVISGILEEIQDRENAGYSYEAADASFDLVVRRHVDAYKPAFKLHYFRVHGIGTEGDHVNLVESTVKLEVNDSVRLCAAEGNGPIDALSGALNQALEQDFEMLRKMSLSDYKVRVVDSADGTAAKVQVLIDFAYNGQQFSTIGVHEISSKPAGLPWSTALITLSTNSPTESRQAFSLLLRTKQHVVT